MYKFILEYTLFIKLNDRRECKNKKIRISESVNVRVW